MYKQEKNAVSGLIELLKKNGYTIISGGYKYGNDKELIVIAKEKIYIPLIIAENAPVSTLKCREYIINDRQ